MSVEHLSDEQIQNLVENKEINIEAENHINSCSECRKSYDFYQMIYSNITDVEDPVIGVDFNAKTMLKIKDVEIIEEKGRFETFIYILAGIAACTAALIYGSGYKAIVDNMFSISIVDAIANWTVIQTLQKLVGQYDNLFTILLFAGITILFVAILDKYLSKLKIGKTSLLSI